MFPSKVTKQSIITVILTLVQITALIAAVILEYLSDKKMGVMRYLAFKKDMYQSTLFTPHNISLYRLLLISGTVICFLLVIYNVIKNSRISNEFLYTLTLNLMAVLFVFFIKAERLNAYHFFLISIFIIISVQYLRIILKYILSNFLND